MVGGGLAGLTAALDCLDAGHEVTLLAANVLLENEKTERIVRLIEEVDPDVLLLMETDERWLAALGPTLARYPTVLTAANVKYYGMAFATRLPVGVVTGVLGAPYLVYLVVRTHRAGGHL